MISIRLILQRKTPYPSSGIVRTVDPSSALILSKREPQLCITVHTSRSLSCSLKTNGVAGFCRTVRDRRSNPEAGHFSHLFARLREVCMPSFLQGSSSHAGKPPPMHLPGQTVILGNNTGYINRREAFFLKYVQSAKIFSVPGVEAGDGVFREEAAFLSLPSLPPWHIPGCRKGPP